MEKIMNLHTRKTKSKRISLQTNKQSMRPNGRYNQATAPPKFPTPISKLVNAQSNPANQNTTNPLIQQQQKQEAKEDGQQMSKPEGHQRAGWARRAGFPRPARPAPYSASHTATPPSPPTYLISLRQPPPESKTAAAAAGDVGSRRNRRWKTWSWYLFNDFPSLMSWLTANPYTQSEWRRPIVAPTAL